MRIFGAGADDMCKVIGETQLSRLAERSLSTNILQHETPQLIFVSCRRIIRKQDVIDFAAGNVLILCGRRDDLLGESACPCSYVSVSQICTKTS